MLLNSGMRALLEGMAEPALIIEQRVVLAANAAARQLFGTGVEGTDVRLIIRHPLALEHLLHGRAGDFEISGIGEIDRPWTFCVSKIDDAILVRLVDRTATVAAERMRVDFVANASHELRTPLSIIIGYAETLAGDPDIEVETRQQFLSTIKGEAQRMVSLIEDLMTLSRIEAARFVAPTDLIDLGELAESAVESVRSRQSSEQCRIDLDVPERVPAIRGDRVQLLQLLDNLLVNAVRYGCKDGRAEIRVGIAVEKNWVLLSVTDQGPGIPRDHLPRVTERFYRVDAARSRDTGGTGLGLAIVKHIVERHRGRLDIRSVSGKGTEVVVRLPAAAAVTRP